MPPRKKSSSTRDGENSGTNGASGKTLRGRRGGLKDMPSMPLDVLMEIFGFMHPKDLMNLARTSKPFRALLLQKSARPIWKASLASVDDLPACPAYLSEPALVNLMFFPHCHVCLKPNIQTIIFEFSARYCPSCKPNMMMNQGQMKNLVSDICTVVGTKRSCFSKYYDSGALFWHKPDVDGFRQRWDAMDDDEARKTLAAEFAERASQIRRASLELGGWINAQKDKRLTEIYKIKVERVKCIKARLCQAGWEDELSRMSSPELDRFEVQKFATKAQQLTDRNWQKIHQEVVTYMEHVKARRLDADHKTLLCNRLKAFDQAYKSYRPSDTKRNEQWPGSPHVEDFALMTEFRSLLDAPDGTNVSILNDHTAMRAKFQDADGLWRQLRKDELSAMVKASSQIPEDVQDPLMLAIAVFQCTACDRKDLTYPNVLAHGCLRLPRSEWKDRYSTAVQATWSNRQRTRSPWSSAHLKFSSMGASHLRLILKACGLDPSRATHSDAAECDTRLIGGPVVSSSTYDPKLQRETESYSTRQVYDWAEAFAFILRGTSLNYPVWEPILGKERAEVAKVEKERASHYDLIDFERMKYGCQYCEFTGSQRRMHRHLKKWHHLVVDEDDVCLHGYVHPDEKQEIPSIHLPPIYLKRYSDGRVEAYHCDLPSGRIADAIQRTLTGQPDSEVEDLSMWDSDSDDD